MNEVLSNLVRSGLVLAGVWCLAGCGGGGDSSSTHPAPVAPNTLNYVLSTAPPRRKIELFYFGALDGQPTDHVNRFMEAFWGGEEAGIARIKAANMPTCVVVDGYVFKDNKYIGTEALEAFGARLSEAGVMPLVDMVFIVDEPELSGRSEEEIFKAIDGIKGTEAFKGCLTYINWGQTERYPGISKVDVGSFDAYGEDIFASGKFDRFVRQLRPEQKYVVVAGVSDPWRSDLSPFYSVANNYDQCLGIMIFIYPDGDFEGPQKGVGNNGLLPMCQQYGNLIKGYQSP